MFTQDYSTPTFPKVEEKVDVFSLSPFIEWCKKQPAHKQYCYMSTGACLMARYLLDAGMTDVAVGGTTVDYREPSGRFWLDRPMGVFENIASDEPNTYGAALTRARALAGRR